MFNRVYNVRMYGCVLQAFFSGWASKACVGLVVGTKHSSMVFAHSLCVMISHVASLQTGLRQHAAGWFTAQWLSGAGVLHRLEGFNRSLNVRDAAGTG
jgi:hypothetical protein